MACRASSCGLIAGNQGGATLQSSELTHLLPASLSALQVVSRGSEAVALAISWGRALPGWHGTPPAFFGLLRLQLGLLPPPLPLPAVCLHFATQCITLVLPPLALCRMPWS